MGSASCLCWIDCFTKTSSQFSVLSSQFSVLSSQFSVLSSQEGIFTGCEIVAYGNVQRSQIVADCLARIATGESVMGQSYRDLVVWQKAMRFVTEIYQATKTFPIEERHGLSSQLRRAAVSVPSNIAEGQARFSPREFYRFLSTARCSFVEIETQLQNCDESRLPERARRYTSAGRGRRTRPNLERLAFVDQSCCVILGRGFALLRTEN